MLHGDSRDHRRVFTSFGSPLAMAPTKQARIGGFRHVVEFVIKGERSGRPGQFSFSVLE
jgi:hypothetical protein